MTGAVLYFTFTGNSKKIAEKLAKEVDARLVEVKPVVNLPYVLWLLLSFVPMLGFPVENFEVTERKVVVCFPKWTFNCPPITELLKRRVFSGKRVFLFISYAGWREKQYANFYRKLFERFGAKVELVELVKRDRLESSQVVRLKNLWML